MILKAGYIIDEVFHQVFKARDYEGFEDTVAMFSKHCYYEFSGSDEPSIDENTEGLDKHLLVAYNLISRGTPTRATLFITEKTLSKYGFSKHVSDIGELLFQRDVAEDTKENSIIDVTKIDDRSNQQIYECIYVPILIAQIQKAFLLLWLNNDISVTGEVSVHCNEKLEEYFDWGLTDLFLTMKNLFQLSDIDFDVPEIVFADSADATFSLGVNEQGYVYRIDPVKPPDEPVERLLTSRKIVYPAIGEYDVKNDFIPYQEKEEALIYFLRNIFRKEAFRPGQLGIINRILQCKDVIGILPTGSGKSLTYQLTTLLQPGITVIIDPIRSLMIDQYDKLRENFIDRALYVNSFDNKKERNKKQTLLADGQIQYAIIGPERFQMLEFRNYMRDAVAKRNMFSYAVIDEAHCISEWGHDFRYSYLRLSDGILRYCFNGQLEQFTQIALTATASFDVISDIEQELKMASGVLVSIPPESIDREELQFKIIEIPNPEFVDDNALFYIREKEVGRLKYPLIKDVIKSIPFQPFLALTSEQKKYFFSSSDGIYENCGILFCHTKSDTLGNGVVANLKGFYTVFPYPKTYVPGLKDEPHLNCTTFMGQDDDGSVVAEIASSSFQNQKNFLANKHNLMIATKAFGMGIDKPNIRYTIHYSIPQSVESFYQEAGRAGRDKKKSINWIFYNRFDVETNYDFIKNAHKSFTRERNIYQEILTEVRYERGFFYRVLENHLNDKFDKTEYSDRFNVYLSGQNPYLNVKSKNRTKNYGFLRLNQTGLPAETNWIEGVKEQESLAVLSELRTYLKELFIGFDIESSLRSDTQKGLEELIKESGENFRFLNIGFNNEVVNELAKLIPPYPADILQFVIADLREKVTAFQGFTDDGILTVLRRKIVLDAYEFTNSEDDLDAEQKFVDNLEFEYRRLVDYRVQGIILSPE